MNNQPLQATLIAVLASFVVSTTSYAAVPHTFSADSPAKAAEVNANFSAADDRITALETTNTGPEDANDFSGYSLPFADDGAPKNVIVLRRSNDDGTFSYSIRVRHSTGGRISINGGPAARSHIARYASATAATSTSTDATSANDYVEAPDDPTNYVKYYIEKSTIDVNRFNDKTVDDDTEQWIEEGASGGNGLTVAAIKVKKDAIPNFYRGESSQYLGKIDSITLAGLTFNDVAAQQVFSDGSNYTRLRAKGIGEIFRIDGSGANNPRIVVYYRVNGKTGGSLDKTPFEPSVGNLDGVFF